MAMKIRKPDPTKRSTVRKSELFFMQPDAIKFEQKMVDDVEELQFEMTAYSGGVIKDHPYWGNLLIDLEGIKFDKKVYPILIDHKTDKKVGIATSDSIDKDGALRINSRGFKFVSTPEADEFKKLAKEGWPFQASIYAIPSKMRRLSKDEDVEVNGLKLSGPDATVWEECTFKEASIVTFGADSNTSTFAFADNNDVIELDCADINEQSYKEVVMTFEELKAAHPDFVKVIQDEAIKSVEAKFTAITAELKAKVDELSKQNTEFQKREEIRVEQDIKMSADNIINSKLAETSFDSRIQGKIRGFIDHSKFIVDNKLDVDKFSAKVDSEIKDWTDMMGTASVIGGGATSKDVQDSDAKKKEQFAKETDDIVNNLLKLAGNTV